MALSKLINGRRASLLIEEDAIVPILTLSISRAGALILGGDGSAATTAGCATQRANRGVKPVILASVTAWFVVLPLGGSAG